MPDASDPRGRGPADWADAFAALPPETPPAGGLERFVLELDARAAQASAPMAEASAPSRRLQVAPRASRRRRRGFARAAGWIGAATAAAIALMVAWPRHDATPVFPKPRESVPLAVAPTPAGPSNAAGDRPASQPPVDGAVAAGRNRPATDAAAIELPKAVQAARKPRYAAGHATTHHAPASRGHEDGNAGDGGKLDALYAESARLEALLALARDDRVASASAALLATELEAQVAVIDANLALPGLDDARRATLWQARVDALRQAAGFESTQRVLASQGDGGALLVSVD